MKIRTIEWKDGKIKIIDQTLLPHRLKYLTIDNIRDLRRAIRRLSVRGAPVLGAAAGLGVYLGVRGFKACGYESFIRRVKNASDYLAASRPTARNLCWGIERVSGVAFKNKGLSVEEIKRLILKEALSIIDEDKQSCRNIAESGAGLIKNNDAVITICNAGILATCGYGTALGVLYRARQDGKVFKVYALETRPLLQGIRLTAWELKKNGIDVRVICDNTAGALIKDGKINRVIAGADRIALNGDTANKIGTYNLAILCQRHRLPFYIAAPLSTFDSSLETGKDIIIEERNPREVSTLLFKRETAPRGVKVANPAFDVTEHKLITAIITDCGIIRAPFEKKVRKLLC